MFDTHLYVSHLYAFALRGLMSNLTCLDHIHSGSMNKEMHVGYDSREYKQLYNTFIFCYLKACNLLVDGRSS